MYKEEPVHLAEKIVKFLFWFYNPLNSVYLLYL